MTPQERKTIETRIYLEIHKTENHGCITDAADFLRHKDSSRISRLVNPNDGRAHSIFGEVLDVIQGFNNKHPELAQFIREELIHAMDAFMAKSEEEIKLAELIEIADRTAMEQLEVNSAISRRKSREDIKREAHQAFEHSKLQYEKALKLCGEQPVELDGLQ